METLQNIGATLWEILAPIVLLIATPVISALVYKLWAKLGLDSEKLNRDAFQTAISTAALEAVLRMGGPAMSNKISTVALEAAVAQVKASVPDAIEMFGAQHKSIERRVLAQATAIIQSVPTVAAPPPPPADAAPQDPPAPIIDPQPQPREQSAFEQVMYRMKGGRP